MAKPEKREGDRSLLKHLPPVDEALQALEKGAGAKLEPAARTRLARRVLGRLREEIESGAWQPASRQEGRERAAREAREAASRLLGPHPRPVINATGVLLHTNLGRAPLSAAAIAAAGKASEGYSDLEYDLEAGERGSRLARLEEMLCVFTGAEGAMAVNNNAGAVLLALNTFAEGREVIVSRGHLVEIGGSFRMPAIMAKSGCRMVEVGTTNKTHLHDFADAITKRTALILHVHQSNFAQKGFVKQVPLDELAALGREKGVPVVDDQGSGIVREPGLLGAPDEPTVDGSLRAGVTVVTASGDKLLGGPQAGIVMGEGEWVAAMKANPLARALRLDKLQIAALEATLRAYLTGEADGEVPVRVMALAKQAELKARAEAIRDGIKQALVGIGGTGKGAGKGESKGKGRSQDIGMQAVPLKVGTARSSSVLGGGSSPDVTTPGWAVVLTPLGGRPGGKLKASDLERALREGDPPVICRVSEEKVMLQVRSLFPDQDARLPRLVAAAVSRAMKRRR